MHFFGLFFHELSHLAKDILPFFAISILVGAFLDSRLDSSKLLSYFQNKSQSVLAACFIGMLLPLCSCTSMPIAQALKAKGARIGVIVALLMITPFSWLYSLMLTYSLLGLSFVVGHLIFALCSALILGYLFNFLQDMGVQGFAWSPPPLPDHTCHNPAHAHYHHHGDVSAVQEARPSFLASVFRIASTLGPYLILALVVASLVMTLLPETLMQSYMSHSQVLSYGIAILCGLPFHACAGEEVPIIFSLLKLGMPTGPVFCFMVTSVGTGIPTIILAKKVLGMRPTVLYIVTHVVLAVCSGILFQWFVPFFIR
ncbi:MAG: hypothetical protein EXS67_01725 [Candidatus Margulisbacteria bacterium]|nr:hypothetical protein [Candidatus Margulisiibacteriota bacterium]